MSKDWAISKLLVLELIKIKHKISAIILIAFLIASVTGVLLLDVDGDGLSGFSEINLQTNLSSSNSDGDSLNDGDEVEKYQTNPLDADSDSDGIDDSPEIQAHSTDPNDSDSDDDGIDDNAEINHIPGSNDNDLNDDNDENNADLGEDNAESLDDFADEAAVD